jgi:hypothetical protein
MRATELMHRFVTSTMRESIYKWDIAKWEDGVPTRLNEGVSFAIWVSGFVILRVTGFVAVLVAGFVAVRDRDGLRIAVLAGECERVPVGWQLSNGLYAMFLRPFS